MTPRASLVLLFALVLLVAGERPAYAYVDPGSASYVFQFLIGGALAGVYLIRTYWTRVRDSISARFSRPRASR